MLRLRRGGEYFRVADTIWANPLDGRHAAAAGGRWNPPNSFPVVYLNRDRRVSRANVARKYGGRPYGPELLRATAGPILIATTVPEADYVDVITDAGCEAVGLPREYPRAPGGNSVPGERCQPIGHQAWEAGEKGIACRSAAPGAPKDGEELAWFHLPGTTSLAVNQRLPFADWFWTD